MSTGIGIMGQLSVKALALAAAAELAEHLSIAKVLASIAGYPMPHPNCDCATCRYRWSLIRGFMPKDGQRRNARVEAMRYKGQR